LTFVEVFARNFCLWTLPFFIGLQYTYVAELPAFRSVFKEWKLDSTSIWTVGLLSIVTTILIGVQAILWAASGTLVFSLYLSWLIVMVVMISLMTLVFYEGTNLHHYFISLVLLSLLGHPSAFSEICHGFCFGIFIEGCCRWKVGTVWRIERASLNK